MKSTKSKLIRSKGKIYASYGRTYSKEAFQNFREYQTKYEKEKYRRFNVRFRYGEDQDIIDFLEAQDNAMEYIRNTLRKDIEKKTKKKAKE